MFSGICAPNATPLRRRRQSRSGPHQQRARLLRPARSSVFDPSLVIGPGYQTVTVVTKDGRNLTGLVTEDNEQRIILRMPGEGEETVPRNNVKYTRVSKLSMMPEGIETLLDEKTSPISLPFCRSTNRPPIPRQN